PDLRALIARRTGALDGVGHTEPAQLASLAGVEAAIRKAIDIGKLARHLQVFGEISAVIRECKPCAERQRIGWDRVALPQFDRVDADRVGRKIDHALDYV